MASLYPFAAMGALLVCFRRDPPEPPPPPLVFRGRDRCYPYRTPEGIFRGARCANCHQRGHWSRHCPDRCPSSLVKHVFFFFVPWVPQNAFQRHLSPIECQRSAIPPAGRTPWPLAAPRWHMDRWASAAAMRCACLHDVDFFCNIIIIYKRHNTKQDKAKQKRHRISNKT